jgi:hypothetical protein
MQWIAVEASGGYQVRVLGSLHGEHGDAGVQIYVCKGHCGYGY